VKSWHVSGIAVLFVLLFIGSRFLRSNRDSDGTGVSRETLKEWLDQGKDVYVLDVRSQEEYESGHIPNAKNINYTDIPARLNELEPHRDHRIVVYCRTGRRSQIAIDSLKKAGFEKVYHLIGDMTGWKQAGLPVESVD
jgi:phage shock protein E